MQHVDGCKFFQKLDDPRKRREVCRVMRLLTTPPGTVIFEQHEKVRRASQFFVASRLPRNCLARIVASELPRNSCSQPDY